MLVVREMLLSGSQLVLLFGCILSFVAAAAKHNNEKRLLLNDPDVTGRRMAHLESTQQELTRLIHRFNTNISTLQAENKNLQAKNAAFEAKHSDLQSKYTALQSRTMQLESHTAKQDKMIATIQGK
jgi:peptidoglycan hydrolase CwlO-like protein